MVGGLLWGRGGTKRIPEWKASEEKKERSWRRVRGGLSFLDIGRPRWGPQRMLKMMHRAKKVADSDAIKYCRAPALVVLTQQEQQKKTSYLDRCLDMRRDFTDLVYTLDGMMGEDVRVSKKWLA